MASKKLPAIQWYPGDWRKDPGIQALDYESRGVWFEMLMMMYESEMRGKLVLNGQAMPMEALARILGIDQAKLEQIVSLLLSYGVASKEQNTGILYNRRMSNDEALRAVRAEAGAKGGKQTQSKNKATRKQNSTPSSSSSSSSSISTTKQKQKSKDLGTKFKPPELDDVRAYCRERRNQVDPQKFMDFYTANGWKVGRNPMKNWQAAIRTWEKNAFDKPKQNQGPVSGQMPEFPDA